MGRRYSRPMREAVTDLAGVLAATACTEERNLPAIAATAMTPMLTLPRVKPTNC